MFELIYCSVATRVMDQPDITSILQASRQHNRQSEITGMLVYYSHSQEFMQLIEGKESEILRLMDRIGKDERHQSISIIHQGIKKERCFPEWSMGYCELEPSTLSSTCGLKDVSETRIIDCVGERRESVAKRLMNSLHQQMAK